jgi:hypothetical protein
LIGCVTREHVYRDFVEVTKPARFEERRALASRYATPANRDRLATEVKRRFPGSERAADEMSLAYSATTTVVGANPPSVRIIVVIRSPAEIAEATEILAFCKSLIDRDLRSDPAVDL